MRDGHTVDLAGSQRGSLEGDPAEHDKAMAVIQALRHFATFSFGKFLFERQIALDQTLEYSSPIYRLELGMVGRLFAQDPTLYSEIILATPERRALLRDYLASLQKNLALIEEERDKALENAGPDAELPAELLSLTL